MNDAGFMALAIAEAARGLGRTHPNPAVGAIIVKGGKIVARGFHARAGTPHAEAVALALAGKKARGATLYSTLEPCNHHGRTPPCSEAIITAGITRVVYGSDDPNPLVNGKGRRRLLAAGLEVEGGVLRDETDALNRPFFKSITSGLPWVTLKAAITLDGKLATRTGSSKWITGERAREAAHHLRDRADAIVVGAGTVEADDPQLTTRIPQGRTAVRVVLDSHLRSSPRARVFDVKAGRTVVATLEPVTAPRAKALTRRGVEVWTLPARAGRVSVSALLRRLDREGLLHVLVEGGAAVHGAFLTSGLVDEVALFVAPKLFGHAGLSWSGGLDVTAAARALQLGAMTVEQVGGDLLLRAPVLRR